MECIILAGGFGTRLRPITYSIPKPILPLVNTPLLMHIINRLPEEVDRVVLAVNYKKEMLEQYFQDHEDEIRPEIVLVEETEPLGTGGAIKNCESEITGSFLVFNGDVINSLKLKDIIGHHRMKRGVGTLAVWEVTDPTRYGIIGFSEDHRVSRFLEKPSPQEVFSNFINAGTYVLEPEIMDQITPGRKVSIEREVYPFVLDQGLYAFPFSGYWVDAGTREDFLNASKTIMEFGSQRSGIGDTNQVHQEAIILPPVVMGNGNIIDNAIIGPYVVLGDNTRVEKDVRIENSTLLDRTIVRKGAVVQNSIIGVGCTIEESEVTEDSILDRSVDADKSK